MEKKKKILFFNVPGPIYDVIATQLSQSIFDISSRSEGKGMWDLVIRMEGDGDFSGTPVISLPTQKKIRIGDLLQNIALAIDSPVVFIESATVGKFLFFPTQKKLHDEAANMHVSLTDREVDILTYLSMHRGEIVARNDLLKNVWRYQEGVDTHTLETHIYRLRQKMNLNADDEDVLVTTSGGYKLV